MFAGILYRCLYIMAVIVLTSSCFEVDLCMKSSKLAELQLFMVVFLNFRVTKLTTAFFCVTEPGFGLIVMCLTVTLICCATLGVVPSSCVVTGGRINGCLSKAQGSVDCMLALSTSTIPTLRTILSGAGSGRALGTMGLFVRRDATSSVPRE